MERRVDRGRRVVTADDQHENDERHDLLSPAWSEQQQYRQRRQERVVVHEVEAAQPRAEEDEGGPGPVLGPYGARPEQREEQCGDPHG